ncbi:hypothetical protein [Paenibacillus medicaginis]|uniref:Antirestriction protein ArdA n=1 Tax=Paenibacillus medicaginis TaxID=1470560 RepID=A0ABV5BXD9_9BACL
MNNIIGKWMYNTGSEENWECIGGEFDTKEEAIEEGSRYFTDADEYGYASDNDETFEGNSFDVGQIIEPDISIYGRHVIDPVTEQVGEQCGEISDSWLEKVSNEDEILLDQMLTAAFKGWLQKTNNEPHFYAVKNVETIEL